MRQPKAFGTPKLLRPPRVDVHAAARERTGSARAKQLTQLDEVDLKLLELLTANARMTNRDLAAAIGIGYATVGARVRRLMDAHALTFAPVFDWERAGFDWFVIVKVVVADRSARLVAADLAALPTCLAVALVFGDSDVLCYFVAENRAELHHLTTDLLPGIDGIATMAFDVATWTAMSPEGRSFFMAHNAAELHLPNPVIELDILDTRIIQELLVDGRHSNRRIARRLGVSEGTVRTRLQRMVAARLLRVEAIIEPVTLGMVGALATLSMRVERRHLGAVVGEIERLPGIVFVATTLGSADISATIAVRDQNEMVDLVKQRLRALAGVRSIDTLQLVDVVKFTPYFKRLDP
ncbi:Lrp/AsnC family transcriptional regulator [Nocardia nepalensis]|uniref:Lrp/AsnC family transcriptional regulator n=1 Tax=Nocardia nepalensis TaxID=3375448 RepID=UPI003B66E221